DGNLPRLHRFGNFPLEIHVQQTILQRRTLDLDVVGELEAPLEGTSRDALIEHLAGPVALAPLAADREGVLLHLDRQIFLGEASDRDSHAISVLVGALDIVGRVTGSRSVNAADLVEQREQPVKPDSGTIEGSKIECTHGISSLSDMRLKVLPRGRTWNSRILAGLRDNLFGCGEDCLQGSWHEFRCRMTHGSRASRLLGNVRPARLRNSPTGQVCDAPGAANAKFLSVCGLLV